MTAAPHSSLAKRVAIALSQWMNCKKLPQPPIWERLQESTRGAYLDQAQAALDACHAEEMRQVIELLVYAKDMKERSGDTPAYQAKKAEGWSRARSLLSKLESGA